MTRLAFCLISILALLASCAGPIETRVQTISYAHNTQTLSFSYSEVKASDTEMADLVKKELDQVLNEMGMTKASSASLLLEFAIADRPASISIRLGEETNAPDAIPAKKSRPFQSCKDREHRLIVTLTNKQSGKQHYRGIASEYHCKGSLRESIPHLVRATMADLGKADGELRNKLLTRRGLE